MFANKQEEITMRVIPNLKKYHKYPRDIVKKDALTDVDVVKTELIRYALNDATLEMKSIMIRTSFSAVIYESLDFGVALYDRDVCLLSQAPTSPIFLGTFNFCIESAVAAVGGVENLDDGDVLLQNQPYLTGSHAQDAVLIKPIFCGGELVGYAVNKAHWGDIAAKSGYCTDTTDVYQEGVLFPGIKLLKHGELVDDIKRLVLANSRMPDSVWGDICAQLASVEAGSNALVNILESYGVACFYQCVHAMYEFSEKSIRQFLTSLPDGRFESEGQIDNDGISSGCITFKIAVEIENSDIRVDFTEVPDALSGPMNCPMPSTVSGARVALCMLAMEGQSPNEGHFRPLQVVTRVGSMFHPVSPSPCYMYGWPIIEGMQVIYRALSQIAPELVAAGNAGDICGIGGGGINPKTGQLFVVGNALPVGQGAYHGGDGATVFVPALAQSHLACAELIEAKAPIMFLNWELIPDSGGAGEFQGGSGWLCSWQALEDMRITSTMEHTLIGAWGLEGGQEGKPNRLNIIFPDKRSIQTSKFTDMSIPKGTIVQIYCGGGGGYGLPKNRAIDSVRRDLRDGKITMAFAQRYYAHAL